MRDNPEVATSRLRTANYSHEARVRLAEAVVAAREAAGFKFRVEFAKGTPGVNLRSLDKVENAEPGVGATILRAIGRALPHWTEDTPRAILEGSPVPALSTSAALPVQPHLPEKLPGGIADLSHLSRDEQRALARQVLDQLPIVHQLGPDIYAAWRDRAMEFVARYGGPDDTDGVQDAEHAAKN
jgi:hypothetical protein